VSPDRSADHPFSVRCRVADRRVVSLGSMAAEDAPASPVPDVPRLKRADGERSRAREISRDQRARAARDARRISGSVPGCPRVP
jgi:hypothetical protein